MTEQQGNLDGDARERIDRHLKSVGQALRSAGLSAAEREAVLADLEDQILEMLSARAGEPATSAEVEAVLAELDPPEAYAGETPVPPPPEPSASPVPARTPLSSERKPRYSRMAISATVWAGLFLVLCLLMPIGAMLLARATTGRGISLAFAMSPFLLLLVPTAVGVTLLGALSVSAIRRSNGQLYGLPLALFDVLLFPLLLLDGCLLALLYFLLKQAGRLP